MKSAAPSEILNVFINLGAFVLLGGSLYIVSHSNNGWMIAVAVLVFSYVANTVFAFLHESVHRVYSLRPWLNEGMGLLNGALFPTGLTFQRVCHLGHHLRNRTDHEMFDMYYPDDNLFLKRAQFYSILTGIYWLTIPLGWFTYLICPWSYRLLKTENTAIKRTGAIMLHPFIDHPKKWRIRFELVFVIAFQVALFKVLDLKFWPTFATYWVFGMLWGSLQYADHAWSPRDVLKGAWNLKVNPITRLFFLNYHYHQVHHMNPKLPWNHLPRHVDSTQPMPSFWKIYFEMWKGPRPASAPSPTPVREVMEALSDDEDLKSERILTCEGECLKQFLHFTRRHVRYGFIALVLYGLSFKDWMMARRLRHGFCALQLIDDLLDGDRDCNQEPKDVVRAAVASKKMDSSLEILIQTFRSQIHGQAEEKEILALFSSVVDAMIFDRDRVVNRLALSASELRQQHHRTFSASLDLVLAVIQSRLRVKDVPAILDVFAWCSMLRDLEEDLTKGLVNIPKEVFAGSWPSETPQASWVKDQRVQRWLKEETEAAMISIGEARRSLAALPDESGKQVFTLFLNSMSRYSRKVSHVSLAPAL